MKRINNKRNLIILIGVLLLAVGTTLAYFKNSSVFNNIFNSGGYKTVAHEEFVSPSNWMPGDTTEKTVTVTNEGTMPVSVRVCVEDYWVASNDDELPNHSTSLNMDIALINLANQNDWTYANGCYYYNEELEPNETTSSPIASVTFNPDYEGTIDCVTDQVTGDITCESTDDGYDNAEYHLKLSVETIQLDGLSEWGVGYSIDGTNYTFPNPTSAMAASGYNVFLKQFAGDESLGFVKNSQEYYLKTGDGGESFSENTEVLLEAFGSENCEVTNSSCYCEDSDYYGSASDSGNISIIHVKPDSIFKCYASSTSSSCEETHLGYSANGEDWYSTSSESISESGYHIYTKNTYEDGYVDKKIGLLYNDTEYLFDLYDYSTNQSQLDDIFGSGYCTINGSTGSYFCSKDNFEVYSDYQVTKAVEYKNNNYLTCTYTFPSYWCDEATETTLAYNMYGFEDITFNKSINRNLFESIEMVNNITIPNNAIDSWDASAQKNNEIKAWYTDTDSNGLYELYIGQAGGVVANIDSRYICCGE